MKTTIAIAKGVLLGAAMIAVATLCSCQPLQPGNDPLNFPGAENDSPEEIHAGNISAITGDPTRTLR